MKGGRVQRFREGFTRLPAARLLGRRYDEDRREGLALAQSRRLADGQRTARRGRGFQLCALRRPGLWGERDHRRSSLPQRSGRGGRAGRGLYGGHARGRAWRRSAKHFPGHGAVVADSHVALPVDRRNFVDLEPDIRPYRLLIENNLAGVMGAHVVFPAVDPLPASLSQRWITGVLRGELGFHGCVFADDLTMAGAAAFGGVIERAELAFAAGCDVLPICNDRQAVKSVLEHFGPDVGSAASQARLVRMRARGESPGESWSGPAVAADGGDDRRPFGNTPLGADGGQS